MSRGGAAYLRNQRRLAEQVADSDDARTPSWWREQLGAGSLRLTSHPEGMGRPGLTRRRLGAWDHDEEAPESVRYDAAPQRVSLTIDGTVIGPEYVTLTSCPDGTPNYTVAAVCPTARALREWRLSRPVVVGESTGPKRILGGER